MEVPEDQESKKHDSASGYYPALRLALRVLERIPRFEDRVAHQVPQAHVVAIRKKLLELRVDFLNGESR